MPEKESNNNKSSLMKKITVLPLLAIILICCTNPKKEVGDIKDKRISLHADTINVVKLTDTLVIYESTCRGCAYEQSTHFDISDSLGVIKLLHVETTDNNSSDMAGGNISKDLVLIPLKAGATTIKLYKFWKEEATAKDSANFTSYKIQVQN
jgi:hypothetical protein